MDFSTRLEALLKAKTIVANNNYSHFILYSIFITVYLQIFK